MKYYNSIQFRYKTWKRVNIQLNVTVEDRRSKAGFHPHKGRVWSEGGSFWTAIFNNDIQLSVTLFPCVLYRFQRLSICRFVKGNLCRKSAHCLVLSTLTSINFYPLVCSGLFSWTLAVIFVFFCFYILV